MSIRTEEDLYDRLASDLIWRKREFTAFRWLLAGSTAARRAPLLRASITMIYAHWEGYVKSAASAYLEFVHYRRLRYRELAPNFVALASRSMLNRAGVTTRIAAHLEVTSFFLTELGEQSRLPYKDVVDTGANLSSNVLKEITDTLGLDYEPFELKAQLIDERLLRTRNTIAHGEYLIVDEPTVAELIDEVLEMLENFRTQVLNAATLARYRI